MSRNRPKDGFATQRKTKPTKKLKQKKDTKRSMKTKLKKKMPTLGIQEPREPREIKRVLERIDPDTRAKLKRRKKVKHFKQ